MALDKRQKFLLPLVVVAFAYVGWQVYSILTPTNSPAPMVGTTKKLIASQQEATQPVGSAIQKATTNPATTYSSRPSSTSTTKEQTQYLQLLNRYQLLKMKHMLLDEEVAIATAKQKIAELNAQTNKLGGSIDYSSDVDNMDVDAQTSLNTPANTGDYAVVYIDRQNGQWNATLNNRGHFEEATIGSILSDGSKVVAIDSSGATIKQGDQLIKLTFSGPVAAVDQSTDQEDTIAEETSIQSKEPIPAKPAIEIKVPAITKPVVEEKKPVITPVKMVQETQPKPIPVIEVKKQLATPIVPPVKEIKQESTLTKPVIEVKKPTVAPVKNEVKEAPKPVVVTKEIKKEPILIVPIVEKKKPTPVKNEIKEVSKPAVAPKEAPKPAVIVKKISKPISPTKEIKEPIVAFKPLIQTEVKKEVTPIIKPVVKTKELTLIKPPVIEEKKPAPVKTIKEISQPKPVIGTKVNPIIVPPIKELKKEPAPIKPVIEKKKTLVAPVKNEVPPIVKPVVKTKELTPIKPPVVTEKKPIPVKSEQPTNKKDDLKDFSLKKPADVTPSNNAAPRQSDEMAKLLNMLEKNNAPKTGAVPTITLETKNKKDGKSAPVLANQKPTVSPTTMTTAANTSEKIKPTTSDIQTLSTATSGKPNHYVLQLMGGEDVTDIKNFVKANQLDGQAIISKTSRNGKDWYVLLYGNYPTSSKAITAVKSLPMTLKNLDPWVKPIY